MPTLLKKDQIERNREMAALDDMSVAIPRLKKLDGWHHYTEGISNREDPSECEGIFANKRKRVTKVELRAREPQPTKKGHVHVIFESIAGLSMVKVIDLSGNGLCGNIIPEIGNCRQLQKLNLSNNGFDGSIPRTISQLTKLKYLNLSMNNLRGGFPRGLQECRAMEKLYLHNNHLSGELPPDVGDPAGDMCPALRVLDVSDNPELSGVICIEMMGKLGARVITHHTHPSTGRSIIEKGLKISHPNSCDIAIHNGLLAVDEIRRENEQRNERTLSIEFDAMVDMRRSIPQLALLDGWESLLEHKNLRLCLGLKLDGGGWIIKIDLENMGLHGEIPESICKLKCLRNLNLSYNRLSGTIPSEIGALHSLIILDLRCNSLISHTQIYNAVLGQYEDDENPQALHRQEVSMHRASLAKRRAEKKKAEQEEKDRLRIEMAKIREAMGEAVPKDASAARDLGALNGRPESAPAILAQDGNAAGNQDRPQTAPAAYIKTASTKGIGGPIPSSIGRLKKVCVGPSSPSPPSPPSSCCLLLLLVHPSRACSRGNFLLALLTLLFLPCLFLSPPSQLKWLYLNDNQLIGEIPCEIRNIHFLERVYLQNNRLRGDIPPSIGDPDEVDPATLKRCGMGALRIMDLSGNPQLEGAVCLPIRSKPGATFKVDSSSLMEQECQLRSDKLFLVGASFASEDLPTLLKQIPDFQQNANRYQPQVEMQQVGTLPDARVPMHRCERQHKGSRGKWYVPWQRVWLDSLEWLATIPPEFTTPINLYIICHHVATRAQDTTNIFRDKFLNKGVYGVNLKQHWFEQDFDPRYALGKSGTAVSILDWERRQIMRTIDGRLRSDRLLVLRYIDQFGTERGAPDWYAPFGDTNPDKGMEALQLVTKDTDKFRSSVWAAKYEATLCVDSFEAMPWRSAPCCYGKDGYPVRERGKVGEWILFDLTHQKKRDVVRVRLVNDPADRYGIRSFTLQRADEVGTYGPMTIPTHFETVLESDGVWTHAMEAQQDFELPTPCHSRFWKLIVTANHGATAVGIQSVELWAEVHKPTKNPKQKTKIKPFMKSSFFGGVDFRSKKGAVSVSPKG
jgi:Leucine-rich repeat (LRR) protein